MHHMGGNNASRLPRISREQILNACKAGLETVVSLIEYLQEQFQRSLDEWSNALTELSEVNKKLAARIQALEEKTKRTATTVTSLLPVIDCIDGFTKAAGIQRQEARRPGRSQRVDATHGETPAVCTDSGGQQMPQVREVAAT